MIKFVEDMLVLSDDDPFMVQNYGNASERLKRHRRILKIGKTGRIARTLYITEIPLADEEDDWSGSSNDRSMSYTWSVIVSNVPMSNLAIECTESGGVLRGFNRRYTGPLFSLFVYWVYVYDVNAGGWLCKGVVHDKADGGLGMGHCRIIQEGGTP